MRRTQLPSEAAVIDWMWMRNGFSLFFPPPSSVSINFRRGNDRCPGLTCGIRLFISNGQQFGSFDCTRGRVHASVCTNITLPSFFPLPIPAHRHYPAGLAPSSRAHLLLSAALRSRFPSCQMVSSVLIEAAVPGLIVRKAVGQWARACKQFCTSLRWV